MNFEARVDTLLSLVKAKIFMFLFNSSKLSERECEN